MQCKVKEMIDDDSFGIKMFLLCNSFFLRPNEVDLLRIAISKLTVILHHEMSISSIFQSNDAKQ